MRRRGWTATDGRWWMKGVGRTKSNGRTLTNDERRTKLWWTVTNDNRCQLRRTATNSKQQLWQQHQRTTTTPAMALQSDPRPWALQRWHVKEKKRIFFFFSWFLKKNSSSSSRATIRATHYMTTSSKTHRNAQPKCTPQNPCIRKATLLHIVPFCEGPNKKHEEFAKKKQLAIFAMRHASHLVVHHPSLIYSVL